MVRSRNHVFWQACWAGHRASSKPRGKVYSLSSLSIVYVVDATIIITVTSNTVRINGCFKLPNVIRVQFTKPNAHHVSYYNMADTKMLMQSKALTHQHIEISARTYQPSFVPWCKGTYMTLYSDNIHCNVNVALLWSHLGAMVGL